MAGCGNTSRLHRLCPPASPSASPSSAAYSSLAPRRLMGARRFVPLPRLPCSTVPECQTSRMRTECSRRANARPPAPRTWDGRAEGTRWLTLACLPAAFFCARLRQSMGPLVRRQGAAARKRSIALSLTFTSRPSRVQGPCARRPAVCLASLAVGQADSTYPPLPSHLSGAALLVAPGHGGTASYAQGRSRVGLRTV